MKVFPRFVQIQFVRGKVEGLCNRDKCQDFTKVTTMAPVQEETVHRINWMVRLWIKFAKAFRKKTTGYYASSAFMRHRLLWDPSNWSRRYFTGAAHWITPSNQVREIQNIPVYKEEYHKSKNSGDSLFPSFFRSVCFTSLKSIQPFTI